MQINENNNFICDTIEVLYLRLCYSGKTTLPNHETGIAHTSHEFWCFSDERWARSNRIVQVSQVSWLSFIWWMMRYIDELDGILVSILFNEVFLMFDLETLTQINKKAEERELQEKKQKCKDCSR